MAFVFVAVLAATAYILQFVVRPDVLIPGLLVTVPVLWGLAGSSTVGPVPGLVDAPGGRCVVGAVAVIATQYSIGGGVEWGGRYFAVLLPVAVAVVVTGAVGTLRRCLPSGPRGRSAMAAAGDRHRWSSPPPR